MPQCINAARKLRDLTGMVGVPYKWIAPLGDVMMMMMMLMMMMMMVTGLCNTIIIIAH